MSLFSYHLDLLDSFLPPPPPSHRRRHDLFLSHLLHTLPPPSAALSCPFFSGASESLDVDLPLSAFDPFSSPVDPFLDDLTAGLDHIPSRKYYYSVTEHAGDRKVKYEISSGLRGERLVKYEVKVESPYEDGFDRKVKYEVKSRSSSPGAGKVKYVKEAKGKGRLEPYEYSHSWEEDFGDYWDEDEEELVLDKKFEKKPEKKVEKKKHEKCRVVEIEDSGPRVIAIRKAFARNHLKGKRKELTPQDAAILIQMNFRAHLARRSQVLRCLRDLAIAKAKLREIRALFLNVSYRRRIAHDAEERQRFSEKIIVLLLTVDALEGPDYMVRASKKSMLEELEAMLDVVDPQPPGKLRSLRRRRFDLPQGGAIPSEMMAGVNNVVRIVEEK